MAMLKYMDRRMSKMDQTIHAIRVGCENCNGPHLTRDCNLDENGNKKVQVCYSSGDRYDEHWRKPKKEWIPYEEYKKAEEEKLRQKGRGFYQKEEPAQERKPSLEEMLTKFVVASEMRHSDHDAAIQETRTMLRNQQASIHNIETQLGQLAQQINQRSSGEFPSKTENNPRGTHINIVTTRSGKIITPLAPIQNEAPKELQKEDAKTLDQNPNLQSAEPPRRVQNMDSTSPLQNPKEQILEKPFLPPLPYPTRARSEKQEEEYHKFLDHIKALQINIPFIEVVAQMLKYAKFLKELLTNRRKMEEVKKVVLNENFSAAMLNKLPKKKGDPGSLTLPCQFGNLATIHALADSGASVNLMPYSFFKKLDLPEPRPICMAIHLANKTVTFPRGLCEDLLVKVDKFVFPKDFIILDMEADPQVPIILGRPFLNTASAIVDMRDSKLTLRVTDDSVTFGVDQAMKYARNSDDMVFSIDMLDELMEECESEDPNKSTVFDKEFDAEKDLMEIERLLEEAEFEELMKQFDRSTRRVGPIYSSSLSEEKMEFVNSAANSPSPLPALGEYNQQNPKTELKTLPEHLEYAFLEDGRQKTVIIASDLSESEKEELVQVLKKRNWAIEWSITDINGMSPSYCSHKINLEE
ncbi:hypothetical protein Lser_V15G10314 [Lactuca serriola]